MRDRLVHVVDDDGPFRDSVALMLETMGYQVVVHADGRSFLDHIAGHIAGQGGGQGGGCALVDVTMPGLDGLAVQKELAACGISVPVVIMTGGADVPMAVRAMKAGAVDFIEKPFELHTLTAAVDAALGVDLAAAAGARSGAGPDAPDEDPEVAAFRSRLDELTGREREVLDGVVGGHPTKVIAFNLGISPRTVDAHRIRIGDKLRVNGLPNLIRLALAAGVTGTRR